MRIFISYARIDKPFCVQLVNTLDVHEVWFDQRLYAGQHWWKEILQRLEWCDTFIYLLSPESTSSEYCLKELDVALQLEREIIPILIHPEAHIPANLAEVQYLDMTKGLTAPNVKILLNSLYRVEQHHIGTPQLTKTHPAKVKKINHQVLSITNSAKVISIAAKALEEGQYDRAVFLLRQAKEKGFKSRFINIDMLLQSAEVELERQAYQREAQLEYEQIRDLFAFRATREHACEAFEKFKRYFPDHGDPDQLEAQCIKIRRHNEPKRKTTQTFTPVVDELPLLEWKKVTGNEVRLEDPDTKQIYNIYVDLFFMAKYPITNAQFNVFESDPRGYCNKRWWTFTTKAWEWHQEHREFIPSQFKGDDRPRANVSWYEAIAFCRWLSHRINAHVTLPTLAHWQRAAIGDRQTTYPWGDEYHHIRCNTRESSIKMTTSVRHYPDGISPFGIYDMAGNVWEWCVDKREASDPTEDYERAVVGGSYVSPYERAKASFRYYLRPDTRYSSIGFRPIVISDVTNYPL